MARDGPKRGREAGWIERDDPKRGREAGGTPRSWVTASLEPEPEPEPEPKPESRARRRCEPRSAFQPAAVRLLARAVRGVVGERRELGPHQARRIINDAAEALDAMFAAAEPAPSEGGPGARR